MIRILDAPSFVKVLPAPTPLQRWHPGSDRDRHSPQITAREKRASVLTTCETESACECKPADENSLQFCFPVTISRLSFLDSKTLA